MKYAAFLFLALSNGCTISSDQILLVMNVGSFLWDTFKKYGCISSILFVLIFPAGMCGCAFIKPTTEVSVNPSTGNLKVFNTKDVDFKVDKITAISGEKTFNVDNLAISDKASPVINANVQQMLAFVKQQEAANEGIRTSLGGIAEVIKELVPYLSLTQDTAAAIINQLKRIQLSINTSSQPVLNP